MLRLITITARLRARQRPRLERCVVTRTGRRVFVVERVDDALHELAAGRAGGRRRAAPMYGLPSAEHEADLGRLAVDRGLRAVFAHARTAAPWTFTTSGRFVPGFAARACPTAPVDIGLRELRGIDEQAELVDLHRQRLVERLLHELLGARRHEVADAHAGDPDARRQRDHLVHRLRGRLAAWPATGRPASARPRRSSCRSASSAAQRPTLPRTWRQRRDRARRNDGKEVLHERRSV